MAGRKIQSWGEAERAAADWMRQLGYKGAMVTRGGADGGIDVVSSTALAQVKYMRSVTGREDVQRLFGARGAKDDRALLFFSLAGYTKPAVEYANSQGIALFTYTIDGSFQRVNRAARHPRLKPSPNGTGAEWVSAPLTRAEKQAAAARRKAAAKERQKTQDEAVARYRKSLESKAEAEAEAIRQAKAAPDSERELAKRVAVSWMAGLGHTDAKLSETHPRGTVSVVSSTAISWVGFEERKAGKPEIDALVQSRGSNPELKLYFFSAGGYTQPALDVADRSSVALFNYSSEPLRRYEYRLGRSGDRSLSTISPANDAATLALSAARSKREAHQGRITAADWETRARERAKIDQVSRRAPPPRSNWPALLGAGIALIVFVLIAVAAAI